MAAIYFHVPFCKQACHYCNFHFSTSLKHKNPVLDAMLSELKLRKAELSDNEEIRSIYFGGGTPSLLSSDEVSVLIKEVKLNFNVAVDAEITLEMNPDDDRLNYLEELKVVGVNRLSVGIQSFHEEELKLMNRAHNAQEAFDVLNRIQGLYDNFSLDLIFGLPNSTTESWQKNVEYALQFNPAHISSYLLTVEPKTVLNHQIDNKQIEVLGEEDVLTQFNFLVDRLQAKGYDHYELSSFGKPGFRSVNNTAYWSEKPYLGIGPSAHSFNGETRSWNISNNAQYLKGISIGKPFIEREKLSVTDRYNEYIMIGLRMQNGISLDYIDKNFGSDYKTLLIKGVQSQIASQVLYWDGDLLKVSRNAMMLVDGLASDLFKLNV
ncbi:MAG: radical SAM family heme chaperone HemW [Flavobacteriales bacterium]|jgi:oxygen-independent coproporphyrinogen-3 oxidase|tara:strand:+ start:2065 stop:3198 length:1134 start_codon:yes stop_codon:yes gene_type:complete